MCHSHQPGSPLVRMSQRKACNCPRYEFASPFLYRLNYSLGQCDCCNKQLQISDCNLRIENAPLIRHSCAYSPSMRPDSAVSLFFRLVTSTRWGTQVTRHVIHFGVDRDLQTKPHYHALRIPTLSLELLNSIWKGTRTSFYFSSKHERIGRNSARF